MTDKPTCIECGAIEGAQHTDECSKSGIVGAEQSGTGVVSVPGKSAEQAIADQPVRAAGPDAQVTCKAVRAVTGGTFKPSEYRWCSPCGKLLKDDDLCALLPTKPDAQPTPTIDPPKGEECLVSAKWFDMKVRQRRDFCEAYPTSSGILAALEDLVMFQRAANSLRALAKVEPVTCQGQWDRETDAFSCTACGATKSADCAKDKLYIKPAEPVAQRIGHDDALATIQQHVREIEILCDSFGYDQAEWLTGQREPVAPSEDAERLDWLETMAMNNRQDVAEMLTNSLINDASLRQAIDAARGKP